MRSRNARTRAVASGSSSGSACSARGSLARLRLMEVAIAGLRALGGGGRRSSFAGGGGAGSVFPPLGRPAAFAFRTITGPLIATDFRFFGGGL